MEFFKNFDFRPSNILKVAGIALLAIVVIAIGFSLLGPVFSRSGNVLNSVSQSMPGAAYYKANEMAYDSDAVLPELSIRNVPSLITPPINGQGTTGNDAEEFEVTEYSANIETHTLEKTCADVTALKSREDVIFENANESNRYCSYAFKVKKESVVEVLEIIKALDPKDLNENTYTIKRQIEDYTSEAEILERKMISIEETLRNAISAYDDITKLATNVKDVESLAKIIDSKIGIIERLTQQRININAQLERLERAKATQLDRLDYTYFTVQVLENKFIDGEGLKDSWKAAVKSFVRDVNNIAQDVSINLVTLLLFILQYAIYFFIIVIVAKYAWQFTKYIWTK